MLGASDTLESLAVQTQNYPGDYSHGRKKQFS